MKPITDDDIQRAMDRATANSTALTPKHSETSEQNTKQLSAKRATIKLIISKSRIEDGLLSALDPDQLDTITDAWLSRLEEFGVPIEAYHELYERAAASKRKAVQNGETPPRISIELIIAHWTGPNGLKKAYQERASDAKWPWNLEDPRYSHCPQCEGRGWYKQKLVIPELKTEKSCTVECAHDGVMPHGGPAPVRIPICSDCGGTGFRQVNRFGYDGVMDCHCREPRGGN